MFLKNNKLSSLKIGDLKIDSPVFLAPMAGVTDLPYRTMVKKFGASLVYSEMISSTALIRNSSRTFQMLQSSITEKPLGVQLAGSDLDIMSEAAKINEDLGANLIDINMGCPVKKVVKGIAGSALMQDLKLAGKVMEAVVNSVKIPVTLKTRIGWDKNSLNAIDMAKIAEDSGIKLITIHGRTRQQFFNGEANWEEVAKVKHSVKIPVIVNGDIKNEEDALLALKISGADGIMIGRGTYGKPWLIKNIIHFLNTGKKLQDPSIKERKNIALEHYDMMLNYYGVEKGVKLSRRHLSWYTKGLRESCELRAKINILNNYNEVKEIIEKCFAY